MSNKMLTFNYTDAKCIVICGDIHGDFEEMVFKLCVQYGMTDTLLIVAGDCGFGFERPGYYEQISTKVSRRLTKANNWIVMIRGNHDDPAYFQEQRIQASLTTVSLPLAVIRSSALAEPSALTGPIASLLICGLIPPRRLATGRMRCRALIRRPWLRSTQITRSILL